MRSVDEPQPSGATGKCREKNNAEAQ